jgi:hypothetical protein
MLEFLVSRSGAAGSLQTLYIECLATSWKYAVEMAQCDKYIRVTEWALIL